MDCASFRNSFGSRYLLTLIVDMISQMPIVGSWYDGSLRSAMGQISMAGTNILDKTGLLDLVPAIVSKTSETASSVKQNASDLKHMAFDIGSKSLEKTGMQSVFSKYYSLASGYLKDATDTAKWGAASLIENGKGQKVDCYSSTCIPGKVCYSPTCPRGRNVEVLTRESVQNIVRGLYLGVGQRTGFLKPIC
jgi:hypothetical protein